MLCWNDCGRLFNERAGTCGPGHFTAALQHWWKRETKVSIVFSLLSLLQLAALAFSC
jgi:hypothetical protein